MTISQQTIGGEGRESLFAPLEGGHPVGWYAVALSDQLAGGQVVGIELGDGRLALYRGEDGTVRAMTPYCRHMGADLTVGDVVGNDLRCAFHHWQYGTDGRCSQIPSGDRIPAAAQLRPFPVEEKWGLVWVFWGPEVVYSVPSFQEWGDEWVCRAFEVPLAEPLHVAPWIFTTNV
ncbi:MAG TPA: Rieske (2Fe-2S) protein, partial [Acidimicrobiia bacterium]|nr:Rieske (2Fe-2S) protein [Acidimicrobiia bacterium]